MLDGYWGQWTPYSCCTTTCGKGLQMRSRECNNPAPGIGGQPCQGAFEEVQYCNEQTRCPAKGDGKLRTKLAG